MASGAYVVRVRWRGTNGEEAATTAHLVVQR
jgi:hypothetical protein